MKRYLCDGCGYIYDDAADLPEGAFVPMPPFDALTLMRDKMPNHFDKIVFSSVVSLFKR